MAAVQMISKDRDVEGNLRKALAFCDQAATQGVQILCFPECASTGFDWLLKKQKKKLKEIPDNLSIEPIPGPIVQRFADKAKATGMYVIFGMIERPRGSRTIYNTAFVVGPTEGYIGRHRKVLAEGVFGKGTDANVFSTRHGKVGIFICADMRSPELARLLVLKGASILFQPTCYFHKDGIDIQRRYLGKLAAQRSRAMENGVHLVIANGGRSEYVNNSRIIGPATQGPEAVLARATRKEQLLIADISLNGAGNAAIRCIKQTPWLFKALGREAIRASNGDHS